ncbi:MAG TPA: CBS and ACT domain-containing protein [Syntrophomonas sp.]|nr:CBS and ACT domain-containing protein [Syntrophomonas sp.]HRW13479.1 CBS and ACT domain-containing protein [Syntrophomonas sp.]
MKVKNRMTENPRTVSLDSSVTEAFSLMKENNIRRLPVVDKSKVIGIITISDLNQATPSMATTLSIHELNYLLAKTKIKDVLPKKQKLITIGPENYIETAAKLMRINKVSGLPVIDDQENLVGIITETDLFDAFIDILGVYRPHTRIDFYTSDRPGTIAGITGLIAEKGKNILNTVVFYDKKKSKYKMVIRIEELDCQDVVEALKDRGHEVESVIITHPE